MVKRKTKKKKAKKSRDTHLESLSITNSQTSSILRGRKETEIVNAVNAQQPSHGCLVDRCVLDGLSWVVGSRGTGGGYLRRGSGGAKENGGGREGEGGLGEHDD